MKVILRTRIQPGGFTRGLAAFALVGGLAVAQSGPDPRPALEAIRDLRAADDVSGALEELADLRSSAGDAPPWFAAYLTRLQGTLTRLEDFSATAREDMARAVRLDRASEEAFRVGDRQRAAQEARSAVDLLAQHLGEDHPETTWQRVDLAWRLGSTQEATAFEEESERAVASARGLADGEPHPLLASALTALGYSKLKRGRVGDARDALDEARTVWAELDADFPVYRHQRGTPVAGLAQIENAFGRYEQADTLFAEALALVRVDPGEDSESYANLLNNIGSAFAQRGEMREAEPFLKRALALKLELLPGGNQGTANTLHNLAVVYLATGDYAAAEEAVNDALSRTARGVGSDLQVVSLIANLAQSNVVRGRLAEAEAFAVEAVELGREVFADRPADLCIVLDTLAQVLLESGQLDHADEVLEEASALRGGPWAEADELVMRTTQAFHAGEFARAGELAEEALDLHREVALPSAPGVGNLLLILARVAVREGELEHAEELLMEAAEVQDRARLRARPGIGRATFGGSHAWGMLAWVRAAMGDATGAWTAQEHWRGRVLLELMQDPERSSLAPADAVRFDELVARLLAAEDRFEEASARRDAGEPSAAADVAAAREEVLDLELRIEDLLAAAPDGVRAALRPYELERVQRSLASGEGLLGWVPGESEDGDPGLWAWTLAGMDEPRWTFVAAGDAASRLAAFRAALSNAAFAAFPPAPDADDDDAAELFRTLLAPLEELEDLDRIAIVPAGPLLGVPFEALRDGAGRTADERWAITYAPSATIRTLLHERGPARHGREAAPAVAVGDPPFRESHRAQPEDGSTPTRRATPKDWVRRPTALPRLSASRGEARAIEALIPGSTALVGEGATERALFALDLDEYRVLHFATHALVDDERPDRSALVLSQLDLPDRIGAALKGERIDDGLLKADEIARELRLDADLVVLSACETALGREVAGEGYLGLADAFLRAGTRGVAASLWSVDDRATALFMERFYTAWRAGATKADALRTARAALREHRDGAGSRPFAHPGTWAAFVLIGDGR
ncbi:MAG: CHAT domain-containing tetratricopeptide repeat protein [Planctomycetota bacterium]